MWKLISMVAYLPEHPYSKFLSQPLELWMFVPCNEDGNVLEEPKDKNLCEYCPIGSWKSDSKGNSCEGSKCDVASENYIDVLNEAKERVLFEGIFSEYDLEQIFKHKTIEDLIPYDLTLTDTAKKQIS